MAIADAFIGQTSAITTLQTTIEACRKRGTILPHTLLIAPPGSGKTSLAKHIAAEAHAPFLSIAMPAELRDLALLMLEHYGVLLIDEVHQADRKTLDALLPFLVDGEIRYRRVVEKNPRLTIIAATTDPQKLPDAFTSRFRLRPAFGEYSEAEIYEIIMFTAMRRYGMAPSIAEGMARASMGSPRQAVDVLLPAYVDLRALNNEVTLEDVLSHTGITERGLRQEHLQYLRALKKQGGVASQATIARMVFMPEAAMNQIERDLLREGIIAISTQGRELRQRRGWDPAEGASQVSEVQVGSSSTDTDDDLNPYTLAPLES